MNMWHEIDKTAAYGEDPNRPNEFIYHVPEYDENGNLVHSAPNYYERDTTPSASGHANRQPGSFGLGTSIKSDGDVNEAGPAEVVSDFPSLNSPGRWSPENNAGPIEGGRWNGDEWSIPGEANPYPYPAPEQLKKDTAWAIGPHRSFQWPGGLEAAERGHGIMGKNGFTLENSGTDEEPIPSYKHMGTGARVEPSGDEDAPWKLDSSLHDHENRVPFGSSTHTSTAAAAMEHAEQMKSKPPYVAPTYTPPSRDYVAPRSNPSWQSSGGGRGDRPHVQGPRGPRGSGRPTNVDDAMKHAVGRASYQTDGNSIWNMNNHGTTFGGHPNHISTSTTGQLEDWTAGQYRQDVADGKVQHVIYHHQTPLAWLKAEPGPSGDPTAGDARHTWVVPDQHYSHTSTRRQSAIKWAIRSTGHGDAVEEPYDPARGFPRGHLGSNWGQRSQNAQDTTDKLSGQGYTRPDYNSRQSAVFIRPTMVTHEDPYGYGHGRDVTHGVYIKPADKPARISGGIGAPAWVVGEHHDGNNKVGGSKRFDNLDDALAHGERVHQWIKGGSQGPSPTAADVERARFIREIRRPRGPNSRIPRTPAPVLPGQEELPFHESSYANLIGGVDDWSDFLRG